MKQLITRAGLEVGKRVRYVPGHANGNPDHPDCEDGVITSWGANTADGQLTVFVRYGAKHTPQGTYLWDLWEEVPSGT